MTFINTGKIVVNLYEIKIIDLMAGKDKTDVEILYQPNAGAEDRHVVQGEQAQSLREFFADTERAIL